jgi:hypothetical protein
MHSRLSLTLTLFVVLCAFHPAPLRAATTLYVAPHGSDSASGNKAHPLASLQGARNVLRRTAMQAASRGPCHIVVENGVYTLDQPLTLSPEDSGTVAAPVIYEAAPGAHPVFTGGRQITGVHPAGHGLWAAKIPAVAGSPWRFEQIWINGRRATCARSPNRFYYYVQRDVAYGIDPLTGKNTDLSRRAFIARPQDIAALAALTPAQLQNVTLLVYHSWAISRLHIASVNGKTGEVITVGPAPWAFNAFGLSQRYQIENYRAALDQPGEWFLDRDGTLFYWPLPGENMKTAEVEAPVGSQFVNIAGTASQKVAFVTFQGLTFAYSGYLLPPLGYADGQAANSITAVFQADDANQVTVQDCEIAHVGLYGIWFRRGCTGC